MVSRNNSLPQLGEGWFGVQARELIHAPFAATARRLPAFEEVIIDQCQFAAIALGDPRARPPAPRWPKNDQFAEPLANDSIPLYCIFKPVTHRHLLAESMFLSIRRYSNLMSCRTKTRSSEFLGLTRSLCSYLILWKATWQAKKTTTSGREPEAPYKKRRIDNLLIGNNNHILEGNQPISFCSPGFDPSTASEPRSPVLRCPAPGVVSRQNPCNALMCSGRSGDGRPGRNDS